MKYWEDQGKIKIAAPAKINLFLEILGKRPDGYHEIETVMQKVCLYDYIYMEDNECMEFNCSNPELEKGEDNLIVKAVRLLQRESGISRGIKIFLEKNIPIGAGLGGGSSDAAATLFGVNKMWQLGYDTEKLMSFAARLGSDIPFFIGKNTAICKGRGEIIQPFPSKVKYSYVIIYPGFEVCTAIIYKNFKIALTKNFKDVNFTLRALESGDVGLLGKYLYNRLEDVVFKLYPQLEKIRQKLEKFNFCGVLLSGSGSAMYGLCRRESEAKNIGQKLKTFGFGDVFVVTGDFEGITK
ncbi:MAG: 4-(cytidine 5'-diphospho)-2-C-methyl-D-erythritol kinase [Candidatus Kuenenia sp.]|nr:4-(cytidine 5'-diphospho)-2-C-methyl-D-erythritol kinase [Candidatus Kuenenia hertensis]